MDLIKQLAQGAFPSGESGCPPSQIDRRGQHHPLYRPLPQGSYRFPGRHPAAGSVPILLPTCAPWKTQGGSPFRHQKRLGPDPRTGESPGNRLHLGPGGRHLPPLQTQAAHGGAMARNGDWSPGPASAAPEPQDDPLALAAPFAVTRKRASHPGGCSRPAPGTLLQRISPTLRRCGQICGEYLWKTPCYNPRGKTEEDSTYSIYYDFHSPVKSWPATRFWPWTL